MDNYPAGNTEIYPEEPENTSEGQTQETVGGMKSPQKFLETFEGFDFEEAFTDHELEQITNAVSAYYMYATKLHAHIKTEVEDERIEALKEIMIKFGEAHNLLAKTKLTTEEYKPISSLLANAKIELFNFYKEFKAPAQPQPLGIYKYLIERKDTNEWFCANLTGYYGYTYDGHSFGEHPDPQNDWTKNANEAFQFNSREIAEKYINDNEFLHDVLSKDCEITEHEFVSGTPASKRSVQPLGIDVDELAKLKVDEMMGYGKYNDDWDYADKHEREKLISVFKAGYAASLHQSSPKKEATIKQMVLEIFGEDAANDKDIVSFYEEVNKTAFEHFFPQSSTEEEKDLWHEVKDGLPEEIDTCFWCKVPVVEPPYVGSMCNTDFPGVKYFTHYRTIPNSFFPKH